MSGVFLPSRWRCPCWQLIRGKKSFSCKWCKFFFGRHRVLDCYLSRQSGRRRLFMAMARQLHLQLLPNTFFISTRIIDIEEKDIIDIEEKYGACIYSCIQDGQKAKCIVQVSTDISRLGQLFSITAKIFNHLLITSFYTFSFWFKIYIQYLGSGIQVPLFLLQACSNCHCMYLLCTYVGTYLHIPHNHNFST
jgi:hypothetical protein